MDDLRRALSSLDAIETPDLWPEVERRAAAPTPEPSRGAGRFQTMLSVTKLVVAGAIVALLGGFLVVGMLTPPSEEAPPAAGASASPQTPANRPVELPTVIPEGIESGRLDTPLGEARWVYLSGDPETLPDILQPIPVPGGYVSLDEGDIRGPCPSGRSSCIIHPAELWFSPDLIEWTRRPLPVDADFVQLSVAGGEYWLTVTDELEDRSTFESPSLWRSTDALEWQAVDLSDIEPPLPAAIEWLASPAGVAVSRDALMVQMGYEALVGKSLLGLPLRPEGPDETGDYAELERIDGESYRVLGPLGDEHGRVRFEEADGGLQVIDERTGAVLASVEGIDMDFIERWADEHRPAEYRLALLRGAEVEGVELPGAARAGWPYALLGTDDGFMAMRWSPEGETQVWTSLDGATWALGEVLGDDPGEPVATGGVFSGPDGLTAASFDDDTQVTELWKSSDGIDWEHHVRPVGEVARVGSAWVELVDDSLAFYPSGSETATLVDTTDLAVDFESVEMAVPISANTVAYSDGEFQRRDHWIITFEDPPE